MREEVLNVWVLLPDTVKHPSGSAGAWRLLTAFVCILFKKTPALYSPGMYFSSSMFCLGGEKTCG